MGFLDGDTEYEGNQYYFFKDHLGSSSFVSDVSGLPVHHVMYMPFGESYVDMKFSTWSTPYKFNAKEQDCETGLYYYGARYYDPRVGRFMSVDPLADQFPSWNPYHYVHDNPLRYTDPDGRSADDIIIQSRDSKGNWTRVDYKLDGKGYIDGELYEGGNENIDQVISALNDARSSNKVIDNVISSMEKSDTRHVISNYDPDPKYNARKSSYTRESSSGGGSLLRFDPDYTRKKIGDQSLSDGAIITHELKHGFNIEHNQTNTSKDPFSGVSFEELDAVNFQNYYHQGRNEPLRTTYGSKDISRALIKKTLINLSKLKI